MPNFFERIEMIMKHYNIKNVNELATVELKYASPEKINRLKKAGNNPSYDIMVDLKKRFPDVDANWLLTGNGKMLLTEGQMKYATDENLAKELLIAKDEIIKQLKARIEDAKNENIKGEIIPERKTKVK